MFEWRYSPIDTWKPFCNDCNASDMLDELEDILKQKPGNIVEVRLVPLNDAEPHLGPSEAGPHE